MRVALVAPPFICVPPERYGGTELFVAQLALGLKKLGVDPIVYTNGQSTIAVETRWLYNQPQWPIQGDVYDNLKDINHTAWAVSDAVKECDVIHLNNMPGLVHSRFLDTPFVYTIHHPNLEDLSAFYRYYPQVHYVTISDFQREREQLPSIRTIHHGLDTSLYKLHTEKQDYLSFIGRIAPIKGAHNAIAVAKKAGMPLKIAGEVQPRYRDYFESEIKPHIDGKFIEYVGEADLEAKNELLGNSAAMLFPIEWDEPFGLVMIEAMACGTPVLALPGGSVQEIVKDGICGFVCRSVDDMAARVPDIKSTFQPQTVRRYVEKLFSLDRMVKEYLELYREVAGEPLTSVADTEESVSEGETTGTTSPIA